jgi:FHA domain
MPALVVRGGPSAGERIEVAGEVELGRASSPALQEDAEISRRHAVVRSGDAGLEIEDAGSSNGTFVNEERITGARRLAHGDRVRIGQTILEVDAAAAPPGVAAAPAAAPVPPPQAAAPQPAAPAAPPSGTQAMPPAEPAAPQQPAPAQPAAPQQPAQPAAPQAPAASYPPQEPTAPQQPVAPAYGQPPVYGEPTYGQPAYGQPAAAPARRSGAVVAAAIFLFVAAAVGLIYGLYAFFNNLDLLVDFFDEAPITFLLFYGLLIPAVLVAVLQIIAGILVLGLRGRGLGLVASIIALAIWGTELYIAITEGAGDLDFIVIPLAIITNLVAVILLAASGRSFASRSY